MRKHMQGLTKIINHFTRRAGACWLTAALLLAGPFCPGQSFYAVLVADTRDPAIGSGCQKDLAEMSGTLRSISKKIEYNYREIVCDQEKFGKAGIQEAISNIECKPEDIIFFYYTGHGISNDVGSSRFPVLYLKDENLELEIVHGLLRDKNPRFCLTFGDCCNNLVTGPTPPATRGITVTKDTEMLRQLFVQANGDLLISSAKKGEKATAHPREGSFYSNNWMQALAYAGSKDKQASWEKLLADAENRLQESLKNFPDSVKHHSQWIGNFPERIGASGSSAANTQAQVQMVDLQRYISIIADKKLPASEREQAVEMAVSLFGKDYMQNGERRSPQVQVARRDGTTFGVPVKIYFKNLLYVKFDKVEITSYDAATTAGLKTITVDDTVPIAGFR
ncbi:MAG: caspase family protein [Dyadobacter fermentans]